ncbi:hypothetical protein DYB26_003963 [Aphanomyces astaci]|uniref:CCHC-type domain-containing protein n=1 Tax=Aphanomyces astaci TaxID=112090 RepID=A0A3R6XWQ4_APHAT|nr:hypothetical protein DYB26_003963 [Aphanomyces astaci]
MDRVGSRYPSGPAWTRSRSAGSRCSTSTAPQFHHDNEWVAWFKSAFEEDPQDLDILKQRLQRAIRFDTKILDAESRVSRMLDELMRSLEQDHQEWVLHQEGKMVVEDMTKSIKPESLTTAVQKQLQLQRNKALKSDVFRYVNWLRTFAAGQHLYVGLDDESKPSPAAKPVEAPRGGKPQVPRRDSDREDAAKNNGRVGGKAETIVPKNAEPAARMGCLKCGDMNHRVARCPKTTPGETRCIGFKDLPDDDSDLLSTSGNRHVVGFTPLPQTEEHQLSQRLAHLLLHQRLKQMALQCRCQPTTTLRMSVTIRTRAAMAVTAVSLQRWAGDPTAADIFGLDQDRKTRFNERVPEVSGADHRSALPWIASVRDTRQGLHGPWVAWFKSAFEEDPQDLDILKQRLQRAIRFDTKILDAESRVSRMLDELMRSLEQDHQEWVLHQEGKMVVEDMTKSIKPESLATAVQKQLQLQRNKALKSDVFRYVNWLRTFAAGQHLYVGLDDESKPSPAAKPVEAPRGGKPQVPRRDSDREDAAKNNGRVGGKAETIVPKNAEPAARMGCLKCGDMNHRVARQALEDGIKVLVNQPQRQKTERGVLLENIVGVDDVFLDSGSDMSIVTHGVMDALDATCIELGLSPIACRIWRTHILTAKAAEAETRGLAPAEATRLNGLLAKHIDVFRKDLGDDPPPSWGDGCCASQHLPCRERLSLVSVISKPLEVVKTRMHLQEEVFDWYGHTSSSGQIKRQSTGFSWY